MTTLWTTQSLCEATGGTLAAPVAITGISIDTRTLEPGDLFIALVGENSDGHDHIATALAKGAAAVMVHDSLGIQDDRLLHVTDTMAGLQALGRAGRARFRGKVLAVTGSVGKTTTKDMLKLALSSLGPTHASVASYNNHWGVPLTLARLPENAAFCVSEIGMNHRGEIAPLAAMVEPHLAVITSIGSSHLGHMGSLDAIAEEKSDLIAALPANATAVVPSDGPGQKQFEAAARRSGACLLHVGPDNSATFRITDITCTESGSRFTLRGQIVTLDAPGRHLVRNAATALAAIAAFGYGIAAPAAALALYRPGSGRGQAMPILDGKARLLDESYNASTLSIRAALQTLALMPAQRRIAVLGDIRELGDFATAEHVSLAPDVIRDADRVYCCGPHMRALFDALPAGKRGAWAPDAASLAPLIYSDLKAGDLVLVKGSLGSRMRDVVSILTSQEVAA